ncbi:MAG: hypothetical protein NVS2B12_37620 [Ktedonobacteraceae bacterium]
MSSSSSVLSQTDDMWCMPLCRDELSACLNLIWQRHFTDMPCVNSVSIDYCYPWKSRLGLIRLSLDASITFIGINTLLQLPQVPDYVLITTIAHEMVHYSHGFGSPLPRVLKHPHANKVVDKALEQRAMGTYLKYCNQWINQNWYTFYEAQRASGWSSLNGIKRS